MRNLLSLGADIDFENGAQDATALMAACRCGRLGAVILLVQRGARLSNRSTIDGRNHSAVHAAARHPVVLHWLLVGRYTNGKAMIGMEEATRSDASQQKVKSWSGVTKAGLPLVRHRARRPTNSSLDWLKRLRELRRKLRRGALFRDVELLEEVPGKGG